MNENEILPDVVAHVFDGQGGARSIEPDALTAPPQAGFVWVHARRDAPWTQAWLAHGAGLDAAVVEALTAEDTRPRCTVHGDGGSSI